MGSAYWTEYPKGELNILIYDDEDDEYSTNHDQGIDELLPEFSSENPSDLYKAALLKYNLKPNKHTSLDDEYEDDFEEQFIRERLMNRAGIK